MFSKFFYFCIAVIGFVFLVQPAQAIQLDWSGQFWFEQQWLHNYQLSEVRPGSDYDVGLIAAGGTYVPGVGEKNTLFYSAFLRLNPKAIVNDSISIKSEFQVGDPVYGFFGRGFPSSGDERFNFLGAQKDNMSIGAQRFWANIITDFGTLEVGRAPLHWGLGAIWNSGDQLFDHYQSTEDLIRLTSKFGNFWVMPAMGKHAMGGNAVGASDPNSGTILDGNDDITDFHVGAKYDNADEEFQVGVLWTRRSGSSSQKSLYFNSDYLGSTRMSLSMFDFFLRKKIGHYTFSGEIPLINGSLGAMDGQQEYSYKTIAVVFEGNYSSDLWDITLKAGHIPGQPSVADGSNTQFRAVYLNKDYSVGNVMFRYNLSGMGFNNPDVYPKKLLQSPYDVSIVNANYVGLFPQLKLDKWTIKFGYLMGFADQTAVANQVFYNYQRRKFFQAVNKSQDGSLGTEGDFGLAFKWDDNFLLSWDLGLWFPGKYYEFTNHPLYPTFDLSPMFTSQVRLGITF